MVCHHIAAKLGGQRYSSTRDMFLACQVIKQDHMIKDESTIIIGVPQGKLPPCQVWCS